MISTADRLAPVRFALFALVAGLAGCGAPKPPSAPNRLLNQALSFSLASSSGDVVGVPVVGGRVTVLTFLAPDCEPCKKSIPELQARSDELGTTGARLVFVAVLGETEAVDDAKKTLASWGIRTPFLIDRGGVAQREAGLPSLPATLIIDNPGYLRWVAPRDATTDTIVRAAATY